jgi:RNA polymerase sigma factor (sigma-70 family)
MKDTNLPPPDDHPNPPSCPLPHPDDAIGPPPEEPVPSSPAEIIRRRIVDDALVSDQLRSAIEVILRKFRGRSYRWNELFADAEDIRNEVALRALDHLATFDHRRARPLPWLMGIAVNILRERSKWSLKDSGHTVHESSCSEQAWAAILSRLSVHPRSADEPSPVWEALARLDPEQQRVLRLRIVDDGPYAGIARTLGISEPTARARVCRALQALRRQFVGREHPVTEEGRP